ncbi:MAG: methyl-accepting chemotaxis protein [Candidatus Aquicultor sp.]
MGFIKKWMSKVKLGTLLTVIVALTLIPLAIASIVAYKGMGEMGFNAEDLQVDAQLHRDIADLDTLSQSYRVNVYQLLYLKDKSYIEKGKAIDADLEKLSDKLDAGIKKTSDIDPKLVDEIKAARKAYLDSVEPILNNYTNERYAKAQIPIAAAAQNAYLKALDKLDSSIENSLKTTNNNVDNVQVSSTRLLLIAVLLAVLLTAGIILFVQLGIVKPFKGMFGQIEQMSQKLASSSQELSANSDAMTQATTQISSAISQVATGAGDQSKSAGDAAGIVEQISNAVVQVATGAQNQATSVNETASGVSQLIDAINRVSESAQMVAEVVDATSTVADRGKSAVEETVTGMQSIKETVLDSAGKIQTLGEKSKQIGEIIEVIDDIAEQTNLLALNAAIEAARAGEHGKGFAVVADEVRKLAERSAKATGEIAELIKGIQDETMQAVEAMEKGTHEVESGGELAANAGNAIEEMMGSIMQVISQIAKVSENADQMAAASSQVSKAIDQIAAISEENSATAEEVASSTNQLVSAVDSIAAASEEAAASAEEVSASSQEQSASVEEISAQVQSLAGMSEELDKLIASVNI